jgi:AcrR family transcriptional regulator
MASSATNRLSPRGQEILAVARDLLEEGGVEALSMRKLAERVGIRAPSIYKHFPSKQALEAAMISQAFEEQAEEFERALRTTTEPITAMAASYRSFARRHPHLYRLMYDRPLDRAQLTPGSEDRAVVPVVRALGDDRNLARATWAFAHGMTILELNGRFPEDADLDAAWQRGLAALVASR